MSPPLQIPLSDALRHPCEVTPFPAEAEIDVAIKAPRDAKAYILAREVAHNQTLAECNLRSTALVGAIDATNAELNKLSARK